MGFYEFVSESRNQRRRDRLHRDLAADRPGVRVVTLGEGDPIELKVTPDPYVTVRYAGASGDFNPIHIDEEFATRRRPARSHPARAVDDGPGGACPHRRGRWTRAPKRLSVQFRGMGVMGEEIAVSGRVRDVS